MMKQWLIYTKKNGKDNYMKMVQVKKIVGHSKLSFKVKVNMSDLY